MKKNNSQKGFTLIELLVVVAIIGILASVVLASLNTARTKGSDAAIKANLDNMRSEAALYYDGAGAQSYGPTAITTPLAVTNTTTCPGTSGTIMSDVTFCNGMVAAASASGSTTASPSSYVSVPNVSSWVSGTATKSITGWWCVDSSGSSKQETTALSAGLLTGLTTCP